MRHESIIFIYISNHPCILIDRPDQTGTPTTFHLASIFQSSRNRNRNRNRIDSRDSSLLEKKTVECENVHQRRHMLVWLQPTRIYLQNFASLLLIWKQLGEITIVRLQKDFSQEHFIISGRIYTKSCSTVQNKANSGIFGSCRTLVDFRIQIIIRGKLNKPIAKIHTFQGMIFVCIRKEPLSLQPFDCLKEFSEKRKEVESWSNKNNYEKTIWTERKM